MAELNTGQYWVQIDRRSINNNGIWCITPWYVQEVITWCTNTWNQGLFIFKEGVVSIYNLTPWLNSSSHLPIQKVWQESMLWTRNNMINIIRPSIEWNFYGWMHQSKEDWWRRRLEEEEECSRTIFFFGQANFTVSGSDVHQIAA